jgi:hypothetical protein
MNNCNLYDEEIAEKVSDKSGDPGFNGESGRLIY